MSLVLPLTDDPPEHPSILTLKARYKAKAERVMTDPAYRASLPAQWWTDDLREIKQASERLASDGRLDPRKSSVELEHTDDYDQRFRFRRWVLERAFWLRHLSAVESSASRLERWENCGRGAAIWRDEDKGRYLLRSDTCKLRVCPACRRRYQFAAIARIRALLDGMKPRTWQFITLTIRHTKRPLPEQAGFLKAAFRRLRQRQTWKRSVHHGYAVMEITYSPDRDEWHPHLHVLARTRFIDWRKLRKDWIAVTDGSSVIDCGYVRNSPSACDYVAKYLAKPPSLLDLPNAARIAEYYAAIQGVRFLMPFGKPPKPPRTPTLDTPRQLTFVGRLTDFHVAARKGSIEAANILRCLVRRTAKADETTEPERRDRIATDADTFDPTDSLA